MYDVIVIGCGPAGLSAAIFTSRAQLKTLVLGNPGKSQLSYAKDIRNYFGFPDGIDGKALLKQGIRQVRLCGGEVMAGEAVDCTKKGTTFSVKIAKGKMLRAKAIVMATGIPIQWAGIKNEKRLIGRGVHTCASCDGPFYKDKKIAVIGRGNHAADDALELTAYSNDITIISHNGPFAFTKNYAQQLKKHRIKLKNVRVKEFAAGTSLKKLVFEDGEEAYDGVFLACGTAGSLDFAAKLGVAIEENLLSVDKNCMTSVSGVFAAGNCMGRCRQVAKNVGDGCNAGINVIRYLKAKEIYFDYAK